MRYTICTGLLAMPLSLKEINAIVSAELADAADRAVGAEEAPRSSLNGTSLYLEWLGQTRTFAIPPSATKELLRARVASALTAMFVAAMQHK